MSDEEVIRKCPNCPAEYPDRYAYCPECGQKNEKVLLTFRQLLLDLLGAFFSFDSKFFRTVPKLLLRPGFLTKEYIAGRRESYLAPFRLYLFVSVVLFLALPLVVSDRSLLGGEFQRGFVDGATGRDTTSVDSFAIEPPDADNFDIPLSEGNKPDKKAIKRSAGQTNAPLIQIKENNDTTSSSRWEQAIALAEEGFAEQEAIDSVFIDSKPINRRIMARALKLQLQNGKGIINTFLRVTSYTLFIFLPVFALFLKLIYIRRKRLYIEHFIFSLHFFSFFFLMVVLYILIFRLITHIPLWPVLVLGLLYLLIAMKNMYRQSWGKTLLKWAALNITTTIIFLPFFFVISFLFSLLFY